MTGVNTKKWDSIGFLFGTPNGIPTEVIEKEMDEENKKIRLKIWS